MTRRAFGGLAVALGERMWAQEAPGGRAAASDYLAPSRVPPEARGVLAALGDRLARPGKERLVLSGTLTDERGARAVQVTWELPGRLRIDETGQG